MNVKNRTLIIVILLALIISPSNADQKQKNTLTVSGETLAASAIAYENFQVYISKKNKNGTEFELFLSDIKNYSVEIDSDINKILIIFRPLKFKGRPVFGGGAEYEIDPRDYSIIRKLYYE